jgi:hypothetical protein
MNNKKNVAVEAVIAKPKIDLSCLEAGDTIISAKGRSIGQAFSQNLVGFEALSEYLLDKPAKAVSMQIETGNGLAGEAGIRFALMTGYLSAKDCESNLKDNTQCSAKVKGMLKSGIAKGRSIMTTLLDLQRNQGTSKDGYKPGMRFGMPTPKGDVLEKIQAEDGKVKYVGRSPLVRIPNIDYRDALVAIGFVGLKDIVTFPSDRVMLYEAGRSIVPNVSTDSK